jgi:M-phase inducer phosphatase 2
MGSLLQGFKRPEAVQSGAEPPPAKRRRCESRGALTQSSLLNCGFSVGGGVRLQRSLSDTDAIIKSSVERSSADALLVGDFSRPCFALPLVQGKHSDLKTISPDTLAALISGHFKCSVDAFSIVDCRQESISLCHCVYEWNYPKWRH